MNALRILPLSIICFITVAGAEAADPPTKFSKCSAPNAPANSSGHYFNESCSVLYVLPPSVAKVSLTGVAPSQGKGFCSTVNNLVSVFDTAASSLRDTATQQAQKVGGAIPQQSACAANLNNLALARAVHQTFVAETTEIDADLGRLQQAVASCTSGCGLAKLNLQTRQSDRQTANQKAQKLGIIVSYYEQITATCASSNTAVVPGSDLQKLQAQASDTADKYVELLTKFGSIQGATISLLFELRWQALIDEYKSRNSTLNIERMPVDMALSFVATRTSGVALPAVVSVSIPGIASELKTSDLSNIITDTSAVQFGNSASGQVVFSALGACAVGINANDTPDTSKIAPQLVANVTYRYFVQSERKYVVQYNLKEIYKRIKSVSSSNGLFRSSYESSITNISESDEVITVTLTSDDPRNTFPDKEEFIAEIKRGVLDRALAQVAKAYLPRDAAATLPAVQAGTPGAPKIADTLRKCPNLYCQAGAVVLDLGSALFGGSDAASKYIEDNHFSAGETVSDKRMVPIFNTLSFKP